MKNLVPNIYRQRLVVEGIYTIEVTPTILKRFLKQLSNTTKMTIIYGPVVKNLAERINPVHKGFECVLIWAESGVSLYTWHLHNFFTLDVYTCKKFDRKRVINLVRQFFQTTHLVSKNV